MEKELNGEYLTDFVSPRYTEVEISRITQLIAEGRIKKQTQLYKGKIFLVDKLDLGRKDWRMDQGEIALRANTPVQTANGPKLNKVGDQT